MISDKHVNKLGLMFLGTSAELSAFIIAVTRGLRFEMMGWRRFVFALGSIWSLPPIVWRIHPKQQMADRQVGISSGVVMPFRMNWISLFYRWFLWWFEVWRDKYPKIDFNHSHILHDCIHSVSSLDCSYKICQSNIRSNIHQCIV